MDAIAANEGLRTLGLSTLEGVLRVCELELVLLDGQSPRASVFSRIHDQTLLCTVKIAARTRGRFALPLDWCLLGCLHDVDETSSWCHGVPISSGSIITLMPEGISEFALGPGSWFTFLLVPVSRIQKRLSAQQLINSGDVGESLPAVTGRRHPAIESGYLELGQWLTHGGQMPNLEMLFDRHVSELLKVGQHDRGSCTRSRRVRYLILRRAEDFMRSNLRRHIYMQELCDAAGVSERALRYAFEELVGVSPSRYLSMLRLCEACRGLSSADASRRSVKSIALSCGLWDLSRFADNYRRVFGELPRDTLMRSGMLAVE